MSQNVIPRLAYEDGAKAMDWLVVALGFVERDRYLDNDGRLTHGTLALGEEVIFLASPQDYISPSRLQREYPECTPWSAHRWIYDGITLFVDKVDEAVKRALQNGATQLGDFEDGFPGRRVRITDPEGHRWFLIQKS